MTERVPYGTTVQERFWAKVDKRGPDDCWPWTKGRHSHGYGIFHPGRPQPQELAHRMALILTTGLAPEGAGHALHACDNPPCCNPRHLHWGTHAENMAEAAERGRSKPGRSNVQVCPHGHRLDAGNVIEKIRINHKNGRKYHTRSCRECNRIYLARRRAQRKEHS